ncbi:PREDICTED: mitotic checkpoint serine/threonine-protein kinase BUB1 [Nelumbo nucifera]|uniref:Mitotic checkpoint serine/threonine-protein kinase BUB1 n=2 Tax=Nelumbo nucifera TaxID=4432 RepID=A0A1U8B020_NELNU|nr:PREDICTED: mitotic checkpoint serine/threonine-protein kinase BUB1 [Nelumbo nucifera]DAD20993.1 TPA_asm: hypothetical protein HUJ06_022456 [Nelumbo nucifera]
MVAIFRNSEDNASVDDPLLPWLWSVKKGLDSLNSSTETENLLKDCIVKFRDDDRYRNDIRFLKIWLLYMDTVDDLERVFRTMEEYRICLTHSLLYESYALLLESRGNLLEAHGVYKLGISRNAKPIERLKKAYKLFLNRMSEIVNTCSIQESDLSAAVELGKDSINPWLISTIKDLVRKINPQMSKYNGYHLSTKTYPGKVPLSSLQNSSRNKIIEIGGKKYQIKGCAGQGGFAQVFKAYVNSNPDEVVALKIQKPPFPWEFYMYRQLDKRITDEERLSFGFSHKVHIYSDYSILVCDYLSHGTLQDAINSYLVVGQNMEEVLCIYYTIEMLHMLETLHSVNIIHGDFKPDNLLMRYSSDDLTEDGFRNRTGPWRNQGLCLVDWGRGIDLSLFPEGTEFQGDCRTSGFRCAEMQENRPWKFQVDTYGLCVIVHMMLHGTYMAIEKKVSPDGTYLYQPKSSLRRYWNVDLWRSLFSKLLNHSSSDDNRRVLQDLRESFVDYMCSNPQLIKKLKQLLVKQRTSLCSS